MTKIKDRVLRTQDMTEEFMEKWSKTFGRMEIVESMEDKAMTKEEFDKKYVGEKIVVSCKTKDLAKQFLILADAFGYRWWTNRRYIDSWCFRSHTPDVHYWLYDGTHCGSQDVISCDLKIVEFENFNYVDLNSKIEELDEQIKAISKVLESYKPPKIEIGIRTEDFVKNVQSIQIIPIEEAYKIEAKTESMDEVLVDIVKEKIGDLHQEIEAFQMTIDEFREKIGNNLEKIEMLEEIIEDCEDSSRCEEYEKENCGSVGDFNTDNYWRSPY